VKSFSLNKKNLLHKGQEYQKVYACGKRLRGEFYSLILAENDRDESRLGISVHGVKEAVKRNRIKRIIREFYRLNQSIVPVGVDMVFAVRPGFKLQSPQAIEQSVKALLAQAK